MATLDLRYDAAQILDMGTKRPLVSIGLPVYNGEATLHAAIASLLAQDFRDFELIISDNASTDRTAEICRSIKDQRIRYSRRPCNIGAAANFRRVLTEARGDFFMWGAADDRWEPCFVADNLAALQAYPAIIASIGQVSMGTHRSARSLGSFPITGTPSQRVRKLLACPGDNCRACSLFRIRDIQAATIDDDFVAWDWANMVRLASLGDFHVIDRLHMTRGTNGASRSPDYQGMFFFLARFDRWLWGELGAANFSRCLPSIALRNAKFNWIWLTGRRALGLVGALIGRRGPTGPKSLFIEGSHRSAPISELQQRPAVKAREPEKLRA